MLDVILYGHDRRGRLHLRERSFRTLRGLAYFFHSIQSITWEWAELPCIGRDGKPRIARYEADDLRAMVVTVGCSPARN